ncbi:MAG: hypothetical protein WDN67_00635 [Candidatus Moraniibacteriota bacterium]
MLVSAIRTLARRLAQTNSVTYSDADALIDFNVCYSGRILDILKIAVDRNASETEVTTPLLSSVGLVSPQIGFNGEYPFPTDLIRPLRIEVSYDGLTWRPVNFYDIYENPLSEHEEGGIQAQFSEAAPFVRFERNSFFIRPLKTTAGNISAGIHIWYEMRQAELDENGTPDIETNLHTLLAFDMAVMFAVANPSIVDTTHLNRILGNRTEWEDRFDEHYKNQFKRNSYIVPNYPNYS